MRALKLLLALLPMAACVVIHAMGLIAILRAVQERPVPVAPAFWPATRRLVLTAARTVLLHILQIAVWAIVYVTLGALKDFGTASYFSAVTYTTTGYGDVVLPEEWRVFGAVEALTGILMCGLSAGMFFVIFSRFFRLQSS